MKEFIFLHKIEFIVVLVILSIIINILLRLKGIIKLISAIIEDTLKVEEGGVRRFSGTKLTMFVAFSSIVWSYHYITIKYGFNELAFTVMACIATGVTITKAISKKINPDNTNSSDGTNS